MICNGAAVTKDLEDAVSFTDFSSRLLWVNSLGTDFADDTVFVLGGVMGDVAMKLRYFDTRVYVMRDVGNFVNLLDRIDPAMRGAGMDL